MDSQSPLKPLSLSALCARRWSQVITTPAFQLKNLDLKLKCKACKEHKPVKGWRCACGQKWHTCDVHRVYRNTSSVQDTIPANNGRPHDNLAGTANKRKAVSIDDDYDALLAEDVKRANSHALLRM